MTSPSVALVIVAYGHAATLPATLAALAQLEYPRERLEIVVVENGPGDSAAVARGFPAVRLIEPGQNLGFAGGSNLGVAHTSAEIVVLINPDLEPRPAFLRAITAPLADPGVGAVGARLLFPDGTTIQHAGGALQMPLALAQHAGYGSPDGPAFDTPRDVEYVTGAALALRRDTWERYGGLDERFAPAYFEEVDLCWRLREGGLRVRYEPAAVAIHHEAVVVGKRSPAYHQLYHQNRLRLLFKHYPDAWLSASWLPSELAYLRAVADDVELESLATVYGRWQQAFLTGGDAAEVAAPEHTWAPDHQTELEWTLAQLGAKRELAPAAFRSRLPLVARLRTWLNRLSTEAYLRPLIQQQNDYNQALTDFATAIARQRRAADAALLCQGMLLAKISSSQTTKQ